jgi:hypothetical protein
MDRAPGRMDENPSIRMKKRSVLTGQKSIRIQIQSAQVRKRKLCLRKRFVTFRFTEREPGIKTENRAIS